MKINGILSEIQNITQANRKAAEERQRAREARTGGDVVQISDRARTRKTQQESAANALKDTPDVRQARVEQVKGRVAERFYDRPEVRKAIAGSILDSGLLNEIASERRQVDSARSALNDVPDVRENRVAEAKARAAQGFYDQPQVRNQAANNIIDNIVG